MKPILFSTEMVQAILQGRKTQLTHQVFSDKKVQNAWVFRQIRNKQTMESYGLADAYKFLSEFCTVLIKAREEAMAVLKGRDSK